MEQKIINKLKEKLHELNFSQALSYGYIISKKLFSDYATFSEYENFGKPEILYSSLVAYRKHISGIENKQQITKLNALLLNDEEITPDTDDFPGNISASLALNAVSAIYNSFKYIETKNIEYIENVANLSLESIVMYFVVNNNIDQNLPKQEYEKIIYTSEIVKSELQLQNALIEKIKNFGQINNHVLIRIRPDENRLVENSLISRVLYA